MTSQMSNGIAVGTGALLSAFFVEAVQHMAIWLIVMFAIIICDFLTKIAYLVKSGGRIRPSKGARETLSKMCTYFSTVMATCVICVALEATVAVEKAMVIFICCIEGISIIGNLLKMKGYHLDSVAALRVAAKKLFKIDNEDAKDIIERRDNDNEDKQTDD